VSTLTLTQRAEQALLGALLSRPWQMVVLEETILREEFADSRLGRVYSAMVGKWGSIEPDAISGNMAAIAASAKTPQGYLEALKTACPVPVHGAAYAGLVTQAAARREIRAAADDLAGRAAAAGYGTAAGHSLMIAGAMKRNSARFDPDTMTAALTRSAATRGDRQETAEESVLAAILTQHRETRHILETLRPEAFTDPARREMYEAIRTLAASSREIDPLTVDWEISCGRERNGQSAGRTPAESTGPSYAAKLAGIPVPGHPARTANALATAVEQKARRRHDGPAAEPAGATASQPGLATGPSPIRGQQPALLQIPPQVPGNGHVPGQRM
jgi:replicative DNA helicase